MGKAQMGADSNEYERPLVSDLPPSPVMVGHTVAAVGAAVGALVGAAASKAMGSSESAVSPMLREKRRPGMPRPKRQTR